MRETRIVLNYYDGRGLEIIRSDEGKGYGIIPHYNPPIKRDRYREYRLFTSLAARGMHDNCDYFGVLSWKVKAKTGKTALEVKRWIEADTESPDYYWIPNVHVGMGTDKFDIWKQYEPLHPGLNRAAELIRDGLGFDSEFLDRPNYGAYCSFHLLTPKRYSEYAFDCMMPCMRLMDSATGELQDLLMRDSQCRAFGNVFSPEDLTFLYGVPYATMHGIILERMFISFSAMKGWIGKAVI